MLDGSSILTGRIQALIQDLDFARQAIESTAVEENLRKRVRILFVDLIDEQQKALAELRKLVNKLPDDQAWASFQNINNDCTPLLQESLDFVQGAFARSAGADFGVCRIADALLAEISHRSDIPWTRFTMLAVGEFFHDMAEIIRVRFPDATIWNLPVACHEFGHFAEQKLSERYGGQTRHPIKDVLEQEGFNDKKNVPFLRELFADLFATYALGPAYACACILLRFDRAQAHVDGPEHPSSAKRTHFILAALRKLNEKHIARPYTALIDQLQSAWGIKVDTPVAAQLDVWLESLYLPLSKKAALRYAGWAEAVALVPVISAAKLSDEAIVKARNGGISIADVLNAAWIFRRENFVEPDRIYTVGENAKRLCAEVNVKAA